MTEKEPVATHSAMVGDMDYVLPCTLQCVAEVGMTVAGLTADAAQAACGANGPALQRTAATAVDGAMSLHTD